MKQLVKYMGKWYARTMIAMEAIAIPFTLCVAIVLWIFGMSEYVMDAVHCIQKIGIGLAIGYPTCMLLEATVTEFFG